MDSSLSWVSEVELHLVSAPCLYADHRVGRSFLAVFVPPLQQHDLSAAPKHAHSHTSHLLHFKQLHLTPTTERPWISECLRCPCGTQPDITRGFPNCRPLRIELFRLSSEGPLTVQLFSSHRSAWSGESIECIMPHMHTSNLDGQTSDGVAIGS